MLHNLDWLKEGKQFPPSGEKKRIERYEQNEMLFDGDHFAGSEHRHLGRDPGVDIYRLCANRISRVIGNFEDVISFPVLLNYQRLMSMKIADLVCGEYPTITGETEDDNTAIKDVRDAVDFDAKLYSTVIDISRYGDAIWRHYVDTDGTKNFTLWEPREWFPIVTQDGTRRITHHVLCWKENRGKDEFNEDWYLHVQIHPTDKASVGSYDYRVYKLTGLGGTISKQVASERVSTGLDVCAVQHIKAFSVSSTVYGYDDYMVIDSILAEILTRIGQISIILDKHADPNITGPASMLKVDPETGRWRLGRGQFYAISPGETPPSYMVWEGQLEAAFKQLELLINQLYILSEMGAALLGAADGDGQAISGTAMRFKMVNPLAKARRISNALTRPVRQLFDYLSDKITFATTSVFWSDGLPDDPRENVELAKLASGETALWPLDQVIVEFFGRSAKEAADWIKRIDERTEEKQKKQMELAEVNKPGPQNGTGINPQKKGSTTGLKNFHGVNNK